VGEHGVISRDVVIQAMELFGVDQAGLDRVALGTLKDSHSIHVMMPYTSTLKTVAHWWVQLWAESLGKDGKGFTPISALGAVDQHSLLQLLRDGPNDKVVWFLSLKDFGKAVTVPTLDFPVKTFHLLEHQDLATLLQTEFLAVQKVLKNQERPTLHLQLDQLNEASLGALLFSLCVLTATMGTQMGVNPFDQPGVEEGKVYIREKLVENRSKFR